MLFLNFSGRIEVKLSVIAHKKLEEQNRVSKNENENHVYNKKEYIKIQQVLWRTILITYIGESMIETLGGPIDLQWGVSYA